MVENARIYFSGSLYCTLLFSRTENFKFFKAALSAVLCNGADGCIMNMWGYQHWNTVITTLDIYLFLSNSHKSTQARCKICSNLTSVLQQLTFVLLTFCFINLEHLSHPTLVLLFTLWKRTFCQNNAVMLTYRHNHAPKILLWKCSCHRNEKQNSKFFFNYDAN